MARTLLLDARHVQHHEQLWAEAVNTACCIRNRLHYTATSDSGKTPYEVLLNKKPDLSHVRMFGSKAFVHIPKAKRKGKLERRAKIGYLVGLERDNSYRVYLPEEGKIDLSRDVSVDENTVVSPKKDTQDENHDGTVEFDDPFTPFLQEESTSHNHEEPVKGDQEHLIEDVERNIQPCQEADAVTHFPGIRRSSRAPRPPKNIWI